MTVLYFGLNVHLSHNDCFVLWPTMFIFLTMIALYFGLHVHSSGNDCTLAYMFVCFSEAHWDYSLSDDAQREAHC